MEDLGFLKWKDPLAWTEKSGGPAFKKENRNFRKFVSQFSPEDLQHQAMKFAVASHEHSNICEVHGEIHVKPILEGAGGYEWAWKDGSHWVSTASLDIGTLDGIPYVAYLLDVGTNQNDFFLTIHSKRRRIWTYRRGVGEGVFISRNRVYCIESNRPLHYIRLVSLDLKTGKGRQVHYEETDHSIQLELIKCEKGGFLKGSNAGHEKLFLLDGTRLCPEGLCFFTVGFNSGEPVYFVRRGSFDAPWSLEGLTWGLNKEIRASGIEYCSMKHRLLVTKVAGTRTFWQMGSKPKRLCSLLASVIPNEWTEDDGLWLTIPGMTVVRAEYSSGSGLALSRPLVQYGAVRQGISNSADGLPVAWALIQSHSKPKGLMLVAYGSYGMTLPLSTSRWRPWIEGGWAVALLFIRGGGDDNEEDVESE